MEYQAAVCLEAHKFLTIHIIMRLVAMYTWEDGVVTLDSFLVTIEMERISIVVLH